MPKKQVFGTGAFQDPVDTRDRVYDGIAFSAAPFDWEKGYDIEQVINTKLPFKNQDGSSSCVGQACSYYAAVLDTVETGVYKELSAKGYYSQIYITPNGGAYIREGIKLTVDWGAVDESRVSSYDNGNPPSESFMRDKSWKDSEDDNAAKILKSKEFRMIVNINIDIIAQGIRDNYGLVGGVWGCNNGSWYSEEPRAGTKDWGHALYFGKAGIDEKGKYIATPNSWGNLNNGKWQKLREEWFTEELMFNPWLLVDQSNNIMTQEILDLIAACNKGMVIENEAPGRKGIIYGGKLLEVVNGREGVAALYLIENKTNVRRITKAQFDAIPKGNSF